MVSHLHGRNRSKEKTEKEIEQEERAKGRGSHKDAESSNKEEDEELEFFSGAKANKHQRGYGKNQDKESVDRFPSYSLRNPGSSPTKRNA